MKTADIKVGKAYGYNAWRSRYDREHTLRFSEKVTVVGVESGKVVVQRGKVGGSFAVNPTHIIAPWTEVLEFRAAQAETKDAAVKAMKQDSATVKRLVGKSRTPWWAEGEVYNDGSFSDRGEVSLSDLAEMLEAAYAKGKAEASRG